MRRKETDGQKTSTKAQFSTDDRTVLLVLCHVKGKKLKVTFNRDENTSFWMKEKESFHVPRYNTVQVQNCDSGDESAVVRYVLY